MKRGLKERVGRLSESLALRPIPPELIDQAFEHFRETGVLPEHQRVAHEVVLLTLNGRPEAPKGPEDVDAAYATLRRLVQDWKARKDNPAAEPPRIPLREVLLNEAVHGTGAVHQAARSVLQLEVQAGADVTSNTFLADRAPP